MSEPPIYVITGAPGVGKTTLALELLRRHPFGIHLQVDDLREWVVSGISHPTEWNEETERQFRLAEEGAADLAIRYQDAGFAAALDHCRNLERWDELCAARFEGRPVVKLCLLCSLEENLRRNRERRNKEFDPAALEEIIRFVNPQFCEQRGRAGWKFLEVEGRTVEELAGEVV